MSDWHELRLHLARLRHRDDLAELKRRPQGADIVEIDTTVVASGLEISSARIPDGSPIRVAGRLEAGLNELDFHARVMTRVEGDCRRCLEAVHIDLDLSVDAVFVEEGDPDSETYPVDGDWVDVGAVVREELMLALPLSPLCADDCQGADPERFPTARTHVPEAHGPESTEIDPRWEALSQITFDED